MPTVTCTDPTNRRSPVTVDANYRLSVQVAGGVNYVQVQRFEPISTETDDASVADLDDAANKHRRARRQCAGGGATGQASRSR
jgi:hypothetical protein